VRLPAPSVCREKSIEGERERSTLRRSKCSSDDRDVTLVPVTRVDGECALLEPAKEDVRDLSLVSTSLGC
jgi:hypothetical protein